MRSPANSTLRLLASLSLAMMVAGLSAGCQTTQTPHPTGSTPLPTKPATEADSRRDIEVFGERYRANNRDLEAAIRYATALRGIGQRNQAAAVLEQASILNPGNRAVLGAYGRALADVGNYGQALEVLDRAHSPDQPDWRLLSVQGAVLDQMGRTEEAREHYESALRIAPDEPSVLSNLGLSYALAKDLPRAEETLQKAIARAGTDRRVRQNLALVVGLQGRFDEAEKIARADLPAEEAAANVAYLRDMLAQPNSWKKLAERPGPARDQKKPATAKSATTAKPAPAAKPAKTAKQPPHDRTAQAAADPE